VAHYDAVPTSRRVATVSGCLEEQPADESRVGDDAFFAHLVDHPEQQPTWPVAVDHRYEQLRHRGASSNSIGAARVRWHQHPG
jgi:hypothetical protein